jgi:hypothetical protein
MFNIPIYWINLTKRKDRRNQMIEQFRKYNISNHIRIEGEDDENKKSFENCIYSHFKAIKTAFLDDNDLAIIVEDDINLKNLYKLNNLLPYLASNWECIQLHYINPLLIEYLIESEVDNYLMEGYFMSAACYLINKKGMEKFLKLMSTQNNFIPTFRITNEGKSEEFVFRYLKTYSILYPVLNTFENFSSDISDTTVNLNYKNMVLLDKLHHLFRKEKIEGKIKLPYDLHFFNIKDDIKMMFKMVFKI